MKKIDILLISFGVIWAATGIYFDINYHLQPSYWLAYKLLGKVVIFIVFFFRLIRRKEYSKWGVVGSICIWGLLSCYWVSMDITKYKNDVCLDKFGREFNRTRQRHGIPIIPAGWHESFRGIGSIDWEGKRSALGHQGKTIITTADCELILERDGYKLKSVGSSSRYISIESKCAKAKAVDTITFDYSIGDSTRHITRQQADSIFKVEKINKDY